MEINNWHQSEIEAIIGDVIKTLDQRLVDTCVIEIIYVN